MSCPLLALRLGKYWFLCPMRLCCTSEDEWNGFIAIWFLLLKQANNGKTLEYGDRSTVTIYTQNDNYSQYYVLWARCVLLGLFFQSATSSAADQLLILLLAWRAGPSPIPPSWVDPISLRVQAPTCFLIGYRFRIFLYVYDQNGPLAPILRQRWCSLMYDVYLTCIDDDGSCIMGLKLLGTLFDPCRLAYLTYTSNDCVRPRLIMNFPT
jgi:hypothetical protein